MAGSIQRLFTPQASSLGALFMHSIRNRRPLAQVFNEVAALSRETALLGAIPHCKFVAPLPPLATGVHAQHSSFEADVRARVNSGNALADGARCLVAFPRLGRVVIPPWLPSRPSKESRQWARWSKPQPARTLPPGFTMSAVSPMPVTRRGT